MVDNYHDNLDNASRDDKNENYEVFNLKDVEPLNDPNCTHHFVKDSDEIGGYQAWICQLCKRGTFYPKGTTIINS
jgi:hypothetical protein